MQTSPATLVPPRPAATPGTALPTPPAAATARQATLAGYLPPVYALCFRLLRDEHLAEDAVQETFLAAIDLWDRGPTAAASSTPDAAGRDPRLQWILAIAAHRAFRLRTARSRQHQRLESSMEPLEDLLATPAASPADAALARETARHLDAALDALPAEERELVILHHVHGLSQAEIARSTRLHPRAISRRIQDGLDHLKARLRARGLAESLALAPLLVQLPAPAVPAGLATQVLSHPAILAWSSSASVTVATASTATAGAGSATAGSVSTGSTLKGASLMSSKLIVAAAATVAAALAVVYLLQPPTVATPPAPPGSAFPAPAIAQFKPVSTPATAATPPAATPAGSAPQPQPTAGVQAAQAVQPAQAPATPDDERVYCKQLSAAQAALRKKLAGEFSGSHRIGSIGATQTAQTIYLNTTVGAFFLDHNETAVLATDKLRQLPAGGAIPPFVYDQFRVMNSAAATVSSGLFSGESRATFVSSSGAAVKINLDHPAAPVSADGRLPRLTLGDLFPTPQPVQYTVKQVFDRVELSIPEPAELVALLQTAATADADFLTVAQNFALKPDAASGLDPHQTAAQALWPAAQKLQQAQLAVAAKVDEYLKAQQSGPEAWSTFSITSQNQVGFLARALVALGTQSGSAGGATGATQIDVTVPPTTQKLEEVAGQGEVQVRLATPSTPAGSAAAPMPAPAAPPMQGLPPGTDGSVFHLESHGESLGHLAAVINGNLSSQGKLTVDVAITGQAVEGRLQASSLKALLGQLADLTQTELIDEGHDRWCLKPKPAAGDKPAGGDGF